MATSLQNSIRDSSAATTASSLVWGGEATLPARPEASNGQPTTGGRHLEGCGCSTYSYRRGNPIEVNPRRSKSSHRGCEPGVDWTFGRGLKCRTNAGGGIVSTGLERWHLSTEPGTQRVESHGVDGIHGRQTGSHGRGDSWRATRARGPGQDMILAQLHGAKPEYTGVVAGMSGSPVYVDTVCWGRSRTALASSPKIPLPELRRLSR